jgi:hypothetical protein
VPRHRVEGEKKGQPTLLTGPAPSGMTCANEGRLALLAGCCCWTFAGRKRSDFGGRVVRALRSHPVSGGSVNRPDGRRLLRAELTVDVRGAPTKEPFTSIECGTRHEGKTSMVIACPRRTPPLFPTPTPNGEHAPRSVLTR